MALPPPGGILAIYDDAFEVHKPAEGNQAISELGKTGT
jgi:hypothetical protein